MPGAAITNMLNNWRAWDQISKQRLNDYWSAVLARDPQLKGARLCVECSFGASYVVRASTTSLATVSASDGRSYSYLPLMMEEPSIKEQVALEGQAAAARSVSIVLQEAPIDVSAIVASGSFLAGRVEISLQVNGQDHDLRYVLLRGTMSGVSFSDQNRTVRFKASDSRNDESTLVPARVIDDTRFPSAQDTARGERVPIVFNNFNKIPCKRVLDSYTVTGLKYLVCEAGYGVVTVDEVYVDGEVSQIPAHTYTDGEEADGYGESAIILDFSASSGPWEDRTSVHADISIDRRYSVVEIAKLLLAGYSSFGSFRLNLYRFSQAQASMRGYAPPFAVLADGEEASTSIDVVTRSLIREFPMLKFVYEGGGLGPVVYDRRVGPATRGPTLTGGVAPMIQKTGGYVERGLDKLFNSFQIRYAHNMLDNTYGKVAERSPSNSALCSLLFKETGVIKPFAPLDAVFISSDVTADYVIDWLVAHYATPSFYVEWEVLPWAFMHFAVGLNVRYTDPRMPAFTDCQATIEMKEWRLGAPVIGFRVWHPFWTPLIHGS